ncbi:hypothetical protein ALNOE001_19030 [Candidatus Methanobinarius endosymbioticus]|uniref:Uncharacterized protein n=1 Tax=Candidatus Methanobinarius endosymbioticus TaxID=2006182 RepID=A0A366MAJ5_9EURY|nr:hypothetical protein ALNOE001_19030 [Candidatus Methanobinarius endosymbioticus]
MFKMINKQFIIIILLVLVVISSFNSVSAASVDINNNTWSNSDIMDFFNGNNVNGFI